MEIHMIISALQSSYPHSRNYIYKGKWLQAFIAAISGIFWVDISNINSYDWSMILKATINQS